MGQKGQHLFCSTTLFFLMRTLYQKLGYCINFTVLISSDPSFPRSYIIMLVQSAATLSRPGTECQMPETSGRDAFPKQLNARTSTA